MRWPMTSAAATCRCRWSAWRRCAGGRWCGSACRRRRSRWRRSRASSSAAPASIPHARTCRAGMERIRWPAAMRCSAATPPSTCPTARSSTSATPSSATSPLELPPTPLSAVMSNEQWEQVYARLVELVRAHRTTLVFVNTRRMAERAAFHLGELLGREVVATHHGSLSKELRLEAEQKLKRGELQVLVATASLELGLDIGDVDLVCQLGSPRSIAAFLQRAGRSGHHVGGVPKARLFPQTRDELVECAALLDCVRRGELDALRILPAPLDVLSQQIVAEVACTEWDEDALYDWMRRALAVCTAGAGEVRRSGEDARRRLQRPPRPACRLAAPRCGQPPPARPPGRARMVATMSGGTIPDTGDYAVVLEPQSTFIGSVNEDFAIESMAGDVFQLGNASYKILRIEPGRVRVEDAQGQPPSIPFWLGEAPGRTDELSQGVSRLRAEIAARMEGARVAVVEPAVVAGGEGDVDEAGASMPRLVVEGAETATQWLHDEVGLGDSAARQLVDYLGSTAIALGAMPTQQRIVLERFFDETGSTHPGRPQSLRQPPQPRLWPGPAQALLPPVQLRAAGRGDRGRDRAVAVHQPQLPADRGLQVPAFVLGTGRAGAGAARRAAVPGALALECDHRAGAAALRRRQEGAAAAAADEVRGPAGHRVPRPGRLPGEHRRRARGARPSAGRADPGRLPARGDGHRGLARRAARAGIGRDRGGGTRPRRAVAAGGRGAQRASLCVPRRRTTGGASHPGGADAAVCRSAVGLRPEAGSTPMRSNRSAPKRGHAGATPTRCTRC